MRKANRATVGAFVGGGLLLFAVGLFLIGDRRQLFDSSLDVATEFNNLAGLQVGAAVRVSGLRAGEVLAIEIPPRPEDKFRVRFRLVERFQPMVRRDSVASIQMDGIVGDKFLQVDAGSNDSPAVEAGDVIRGNEPFEIGDLLKQADETLTMLRGEVTEITDEVKEVLRQAGTIVDEAGDFIEAVRPDVTRTMANVQSTTSDVQKLVSGVQQGKGSVGKLFNDEKLYENARDSVASLRLTTQNVSQTTADVRTMVAELKSKGMVDDLSASVANVKEMTGKVKGLLDDMKPDGSKGIVADAQETMAFARDAMASFAEGGEALKRNFLLRGFFRKRGFYNLNEIPVDDYRLGEKMPGYAAGREWLAGPLLFEEDENGEVKITAEGRRKIEEAVAPFLETLRKDPLIVEGYSSDADDAKSFVMSQRRAWAVRDFLIERFQIRSTYVGVMPMGQVESRDGSGRLWDGVALVRYTAEPPKPATP